ATEPIVRGAWLSPGAHLDLVGAFTPLMREADDEAVARASLFADKREACLQEPGDFTQPIKAGVISESSVLADLFSLTREEHPGRTRRDAGTLLTSVGLALEVLVAAQLVVRLERQYSEKLRVRRQPRCLRKRQGALQGVSGADPEHLRVALA